MADPNWKPCVHSVQPRLVYWPPIVKTGALWAGTQDFSIERIFAAESSNSRRTLGASALSAGADCVSTIPRNFSVSAQWQPGFLVSPPMREFMLHLTATEFENLRLQFATSSPGTPIFFENIRPFGTLIGRWQRNSPRKRVWCHWKSSSDVSSRSEEHTSELQSR